MVRYLVAFALFAIIAAVYAKSSRATEGAPPRQLIVVLTDSWDDLKARMYRFDKSGSEWNRVAGHFEAVVGKKGMAWGIGQEKKDDEGPDKKEGDKRAPAGLLRLVKALGYEAAPPQGTTFPFEQIQETLHCVDDPESGYYNQIVDERGFSSPAQELWKSSELMKRKDDQYKWLLVVDHNTRERKPGAGSCIFIHIWRAPDKGTAGCTALAEEDIVRLLTWLKQDADPMIVQLPRSVYERFWKKWDLPDPANMPPLPKPAVRRG